MFDTKLDRHQLLAIVITGTGLAHFAMPSQFDPINRQLGFLTNTRRHVYLNGGIETAIGVLSARQATRKAALGVGLAYSTYLTGHAVRFRLTARKASA
ncbi:hypothetical protein VST63_00705 [Mycolicibacterium sp. 050232]|uniref:hypothetical protein n=1 Tax=Mycolicibacterium sp. 050232 TaxID=3113982 RepID=UPI002E27CDDC|nr:hypothetical protein [Mycolicibacterium sp. 050232]MED5810864.1 hypothetical protein [Mycolicibacterium sp. 050232]